MLTIDASVWVNADSPREPYSLSSRALLDRIADLRLAVIVPTLLRVEIAAAISRVRKDSTLAREYAEMLASIPFIKWISVDLSFAEHAARIAADYGLRGADAIYAAVAMQYNCTLISLDEEHLSRLPASLRVQTPAQWLSSSETSL